MAVDAAGPQGGQTFTYHLTTELPDIGVGEAVLVEYGRRQVVGVVLTQTGQVPDRETKPVLARVRSDGPLLPPLQVELARHISSHYLAPPALVVRQMLPPGLLERVELFASPRTERTGPDAGGDADRDDPLLSQISAAGPGGVEIDVLHDGSRAALLRHLHRLERRGEIELSWRVQPPTARERLERRVTLTPEGHAVAQRLADGQSPEAGRPLGRRQQALVAELREADEPRPAAELATRHGSGAVTGLARRGLVVIDTVRVERRPLADRAPAQRGTRPVESELTVEQRAALNRIVAAMDERRHTTVLLEGTTASGKSAVYAAAIAAALGRGRSALVLVPEIALAVPLLDRLRYDLGVEVALLHSALGDGERADEWRRIRAGEVEVVLGTRICALAPLADPGVIIVDEEHDPAYKSDRTPRYQARDVAIALGRMAAAPVVLGSATPDVVTVGRVELGEVERVRLPRVAGSRPRIEVVDLRAELAAGNRGLISRRLSEALAELDRQAGEQAILLINRRGSASVVICRDCGYVQICPECQRPLVFHAATVALRCHHCGATAPVARRCPACESVRIRYLGGGTQRVEREVALRFPDLRVGRLDRDVVERKGEAMRVVDEFSDGALDVLVGTALVAKGLDVPQVTLVGVVSADVALNLPDERAAERTFQLLAQAVGRAGRGYRPGLAIVQTYVPDHPVIAAIATDDAAGFYESELASRRLFRSPPFGEVIKLTVALEDRAAAERKALEMASALRDRATEQGTEIEVLGPVPAYIARRAGRWRFHVVLRGDRPLDVLGGDPGQPWSVDVDPESLL